MVKSQKIVMNYELRIMSYEGKTGKLEGRNIVKKLETATTFKWTI